MNTTTRWMTGAAFGALAVAAAGYAAYQLGVRDGREQLAVPAPAAAASAALKPLPQGIPEGEAATRRHIETGLKAGDVDPVHGHKILYYHDPMVPGHKFDQPAKSPFMEMMLVPVYAGAGGSDDSQVTVSPRVQQNLGVRTASVAQATFAPEVAAVGTIVWNERDQAVLHARASGFVERLHVRATLDRVARGQPLAELYVPDWVAAQEEYLALRRMGPSAPAALVDAARQRMRQAGMTEAQVDEVAQAGAVRPRMTLRAPIDGVLTELGVQEGATVAMGMPMFRVQGDRTVWAHAEVPEAHAALVRVGAQVRAASPAVPDQGIDGRVQALLPQVDTSTRTVKARVELANPGRRLVPGLFVRMRLTDPRARRVLAVPTEAVIHTGTRTVVMLAEDDGRFRPVTVQTGLELDGRTEVRGLEEGQRVVVSSQFLIDSEASLKGVEARLNAPAAEEAASMPMGGPR